MSTGYNRIFWGILLMLFHINLGTFQMVPDFVGYALIQTGINYLKKEMKSPNINRAYVVAYILFAVSAIEFTINLIGGNFITPEILSLTILCVALVLRILMFYDILTASSEKIRQFGNQSLAEDTDWKKTIFVVADIVTSTATVLIVFEPESSILWIVAILGIVLHLWLALVFAMLKRQCEDMYQKGS